MAALDFPASPSTGQLFTSGSIVWEYDGTKWVIGPPSMLIDTERLRLTATESANLSSTLHALQTGLTTSTNIAMSTTGIHARNNGGTATLNLNFNGGTVAVGSGGLTVGTGGITSTGTLIIPDGTGAAPSLRFASDTNTGLYKSPTGLVSVSGDGGTGYVHLGRSQEQLAGGSNAGAIYVGGTPGANSPTGGIEAAWVGTTNPQIHIGVTRDNDRTKIALEYGGTIGFYTQNTRRGYLTSAGWNMDGYNVAGVAQLNATNVVASNYGSFGGAQVWSTGITSPGATWAGGTANIIGFRWAGGSIWGTVDNVTGAILGTPSDRRLKRNITDYSGGLDAIMQLRPRKFKRRDFKREDPEVEGPRKPLEFFNDGDDVRVGLIADEVAAILPEYVHGEATDVSLQTVDYMGLVTPLISAVKELAARVQELEAQLAG